MAVACGARLSCSVVMVYSVLLSVSLVAHAPISYERCAYGVHTTGGKSAYIKSGARLHVAVSIM